MPLSNLTLLVGNGIAMVVANHRTFLYPRTRHQYSSASVNGITDSKVRPGLLVDVLADLLVVVNGNVVRRCLLKRRESTYQYSLEDLRKERLTTLYLQCRRIWYDGIDVWHHELGNRDLLSPGFPLQELVHGTFVDQYLLLVP